MILIIVIVILFVWHFPWTLQSLTLFRPC